jgi:hypothetical protein
MVSLTKAGGIAMNRRRHFTLLAFLAGAVLVSTAVVMALAQPEIGWDVIGSGSGSVGAGNVEISDTLGQPVIGLGQSGNVEIGSGYWYGAAAAAPADTPTPTPTTRPGATDTPTPTPTTTPGPTDTPTPTPTQPTGCVDDGYEENDTCGAAHKVTPGTYRNLQICSGDDDWFAPTQPTGCVDDRYEENDSCGAARKVTPGTYRNLQICSGDDDWFGVDLKAGDTMTLTILFTHTQGDLDMSLYYTDCSTEIDSSTSTTDNEQVVYNTAIADGTYNVRIYGYGGDENSYDMVIEVPSAGPTSTPTPTRTPTRTPTPTPTRTTGHPPSPLAAWTTATRRTTPAARPARSRRAPTATCRSAPAMIV